MFGDAEPEDAWDPDDPVVDLVDNIVRRLVIILALRVIDQGIEARLRWLLGDLEHIGQRIRIERTGETQPMNAEAEFVAVIAAARAVIAANRVRLAGERELDEALAELARALELDRVGE